MPRPIETSDVVLGSPARARKGVRYFFSGDTGYRFVPKHIPEADLAARSNYPHCPAFAEIGARVGPFDLASLPIGAYRPRWFMSSLHMDPDDAVCTHLDLRARTSCAMHWGAFPLTLEPMDEPPRNLATARTFRGVSPDAFRVVPVGATVRVAPFDGHSDPWQEDKALPPPLS